MIRFYGKEGHIKKVKYVLNKLPKDVQKRVKDRCLICAIGMENGIYFPETDIKDKSLIIINFYLMERMNVSITKQRNTIAHELAHYISRHKGNPNKETRKQRELDADRLVMKWGF